MTDLEPLTSLMQRELVILSRDFGRASRGFSEMARVLRELRTGREYAKTATNKGADGGSSQLTLPDVADPFRVPLSEDHD